ncbi:TraR/DksA C4-type zinc finger protein [Gynuella sp.]|uniref:TraR/DksA C4-type zinc finger protein n=1 Tax=Gynuella sp. TaxID=2969146 RepID=UPI003D1075FB
MDNADYAADLEQLHIAHALSAQKQSSQDAVQRVSNTGNVHCLDCGFKLDTERLKVKPGASRCVDCQTDFERLHRHRHR